MGECGNPGLGAAIANAVCDALRDLGVGLNEIPITPARMRAAVDGETEGVAIAVETVHELRRLDGVAGVHLYAIEWPQAVARVVERAGLLPRPIV